MTILEEMTEILQAQVSPVLNPATVTEAWDLIKKHLIRKMTPRLVAQILTELEDGKQWKVIANQYDVSYDEIRALKAKFNVDRKSKTFLLQDRIFEARERGNSYYNIAKEEGISIAEAKRLRTLAYMRRTRRAKEWKQICCAR